MKSIIVLFLFMNSLFLESPGHQEGKIKAELVGIEYYSMNICKDIYPVYVRVLYSLNTEDPGSFKMKHSFSDDITAIIPVTETDKKGNIVYGFCTTFEDIRTFTTTFILGDGDQSNPVTVIVNVKEAKIISGTAPLTIKN
jgi:hypothetical protein